MKFVLHDSIEVVLLSADEDQELHDVVAEGVCFLLEQGGVFRATGRVGFLDVEGCQLLVGGEGSLVC